MANQSDGQVNPCGAYFPVPGNTQPLVAANSDCAGGSQFPHQPYGFFGRSGGFCCDMMSRIHSTGQWIYSHYYPPFVTTFAVKGSCKGCPNQSWEAHTSSDSSGGCIIPIGTEPCRHCPSPGDWIDKWHQCYFGLDDAFGCTNPNSFGIVTSNTLPGHLAYAGSPNGSCMGNCMQLAQTYFQDYAVGGVTTSLADYPPCNFNEVAYFDCEPPEYDLDGNPGASGSKLIWAGYAPRVSVFPYSFFNYQNYPVNVNGTHYRLVDNGFKGYLQDTWNSSNAWGQKGGPVNTTPHLWARKSGFNITAPTGPTPSFLDFDGCCSFVSFGCKDPAFGSYDTSAQLNCDGRVQINQTVSPTPLNPNPPNNGCSTINGTPTVCYGSDFNCEVCVDSSGEPNALLPTGAINPNYNINYGNYYPATDPNIITTGYDPDDPDTCYQEIWDACGGSGTLSSDAWGEMQQNRPTSHLYGQGEFWDKSGNNLSTSSVRPLCQCNNQGCTQIGATNYSPLNSTDCAGNDVPSISIDVSCCTILEYGCSDPSYNQGVQNNYFCTQNTNTNTPPQNAGSCMDPSNGAPCLQSGVWSCGPQSGVNPLGGVPTNPNLPNGGFVPTNPTIILMDDGTCQVTSIAGCKDDGGSAIGGSWPSPLHPGFSAINFFADATIHVQEMCYYSFGCVDPMASNFNATPICGGGSLQDELGFVNATHIDANLGQLPITDPTFLSTNLIPNITCCNYNLVGQGPGCMDPNALNYNPNATEDCINACGTHNCCCTYNVEGCTDPEAINFNSNATLDDGTCLYSLDFPEEGTNFLDGSLVELCREPLVKEEVLMNVCQPTEIQSEVFIERGKQSVFETNQRLGEVNTIGGLQIYGYGFYNIKEQI